jgi:hypothetical protein
MQVKINKEIVGVGKSQMNENGVLGICSESGGRNMLEKFTERAARRREDHNDSGVSSFILHPII